MVAQTPQKSKDTAAMISLVWDLGFIFAVPLVVFGIIGRILDTRMGTKPLFLLIGIVGAAVASSVGVFYKVRKLMASTDDQEGSKPKEPPRV